MALVLIRGHKAQTGTRAQQTPKSVPRPVFHASPTHPQQTTSARDRTDLTHSCTHTTHGHATCGLMRARAHAHTRCTHPLARAPTLAHRHILRTDPRARSHHVHTPSCVRTYPRLACTNPRAHAPCTHPLARAHALSADRRRAEREQPPGARLGAARRGRGAGRCRSCLPEPRPPDSPREPGRVELGRPGHAGARERSAAGSAPWTPRRVAARRMTAWTPAPRLEGEPRRPGRAVGEGGTLRVARRLFPAGDLPGPRARATGAGLGPLGLLLPPGPLGKPEGLW